MTRSLILAASITTLVAISGQAFARIAAPDTSHCSRACMEQRTMNALDSAAPTGETNTHPYHGGPKSND
jgi:hypothetical protein